jgi:hypothetical protein
VREGVAFWTVFLVLGALLWLASIGVWRHSVYMLCPGGRHVLVVRVHHVGSESTLTPYPRITSGSRLTSTFSDVPKR